MRVLVLVAAVLVLMTTAALACSRAPGHPQAVLRDEVYTLPRTAESTATTGQPIRLQDAVAKLEPNAPLEYTEPLAGAGRWLLLFQQPRTGPTGTGNLEFVLWNPETGQRRVVVRSDALKDMSGAYVGFDGTWILFSRRLSDKGSIAALVIHNVKSGEQREITTFDRDALIGGWRWDAGLMLLDGRVMLAQTVRNGPDGEREQIRVYDIKRKQWETPVDLPHPPGERTLLTAPTLGGDRIAWRQASDGSRPDTIVVLDRRTDRKIQFDAPEDVVVALVALSTDGRYMIWSGGPPNIPAGPNTVRQTSRPRIFSTDLQTMETVDVGEGNPGAGPFVMTAGARVAAMPSRPFRGDPAVWGIVYDLHAHEVRMVIDEAPRGSEIGTVIGDWVMVGERGVDRPGNREPAGVETLYFFKLP